MNTKAMIALIISYFVTSSRGFSFFGQVFYDDKDQCVGSPITGGRRTFLQEDSCFYYNSTASGKHYCDGSNEMTILFYEGQSCDVQTAEITIDLVLNDCMPYWVNSSIDSWMKLSCVNVLPEGIVEQNFRSDDGSCTDTKYYILYDMDTLCFNWTTSSAKLDCSTTSDSVTLLEFDGDSCEGQSTGNSQLGGYDECNEAPPDFKLFCNHYDCPSVPFYECEVLDCSRRCPDECEYDRVGFKNDRYFFNSDVVCCPGVEDQFQGSCTMGTSMSSECSSISLDCTNYSLPICAANCSFCNDVFGFRFTSSVIQCDTGVDHCYIPTDEPDQSFIAGSMQFGAETYEIDNICPTGVSSSFISICVSGGIAVFVVASIFCCCCLIVCCCCSRYLAGIVQDKENKSTALLLCCCTCMIAKSIAKLCCFSDTCAFCERDFISTCEFCGNNICSKHVTRSVDYRALSHAGALKAARKEKKTTQLHEQELNLKYAYMCPFCKSKGARLSTKQKLLVPFRFCSSKFSLSKEAKDFHKENKKRKTVELDNYQNLMSKTKL